MQDGRSFEQLKDLGAGVPAPDPIAALYPQAFADFGIQALWSRRPSAHPTIAQALVIADGLRTAGSMRSRPLAIRIEAAYRAAL